MGAKEKKLINEILGNLPKDERLFRTNAGMAWAGEIVKRDGNIMTLKNPIPFHGLPKGTPDLCGWKTIEITPDMVGQKVAVFLGVEIKATKYDKLRKPQQNAKRIIELMGGIHREVRDDQVSKNQLQPD